MMILALCGLLWLPSAPAGAQNTAGGAVAPPPEAESGDREAAAPEVPAVPAVVPDTLIFAAPLSGPLSAMGRSAVNGAELAAKTWGGGYNLEIVDEAGPERDDIDLNKVAVVVGYFTESRFAADAPRYLYLKKPVLLPFLTTGEAASRGPSCFFRLMPTFEDQGRFMALEILEMKKRYRRILIITGEGEFQAAFTRTLTESLADPPQPAPPDQAAQGKKGQKIAPPLKPLDPKASVLTVSLEQALDPEGIPELTKVKPELIILALSVSESLTMAPALTEPRFAGVPVWGGVSMGFREAAAAFSALDVKLRLCLPVADPSNAKNGTAQDFIQKYRNIYHSDPTWMSALAYDGLMLAIKAAGNGPTSAESLAFLSGQDHHSLGAYKIVPGGGGEPPLAFMSVTQDSLGFLP